MISNICLHCDGRGFELMPSNARYRIEGDSEWKPHYIKGDTCPQCKGTGEAGPLLASRYFAYCVTVLVIAAFIYNIGRSFF